MTADTSHVAVRVLEWQRLGPDDAAGSSLRGRRLEPHAREAARELGKRRLISILELADGIEIQTTSYVGNIRLGDLALTIAPKIPGPQLVSLFRYAYGLRDLKLFDATSYSTGGSLFLDLLIVQLKQEARELIARGLCRRYVPRTDDLQSPRGRIDMKQLAAQGGVSRGALPCRHFPRSEDNLFNQVLLAGLNLAASLADDATLRAEVKYMARLLSETISTVRVSTALLARAKRELNRLVAAYAPSLRLIELLHEGTRLSFEDHAPTDSLPGFLFDMNRFFETLLGRFLVENLEDHEVQTQYGLAEMFRYVPNANPKKRSSPSMRPDFAVWRGGKLVTLLDAKYRDVWERSLPREMLYQLALYALSQGKGAQATILYPTMDPAARDARIEITDPVDGGGRAFVSLRPVDLTVLESAIRDESPQGSRRRAKIARAFARAG